MYVPVLLLSGTIHSLYILLSTSLQHTSDVTMVSIRAFIRDWAGPLIAVRTLAAPSSHVTVPLR